MRFAEKRNKLVHYPDARANKFVFRTLANERQFALADVDSRNSCQRASSCDLHRSRRTQPGPNRHFTAYFQPRSMQSIAGSLEHDRDANRIITPMPASCQVRIIKIDFYFIVEILRTDLEFAIFARRDAGPRVEINRRRHHKAVVVICVLADEIDAPRRTEDATFSA